MGLLRHVFDFVVRPTHSRTMGFLTVLTLVIAVFLTVTVAQQQQNIRQQAEEQGRPIQILSRVEIQPASLTTSVGASSIGMSALAYDVNDKPIWEEVSYNWGISSSNSIGILNPTTGNITTFRPLNAGSGDLFVHATFSNKTVVKSMFVTVGTKLTLTPTLAASGDTEMQFINPVTNIFTDKNGLLISRKNQDLTVYFYKSTDNPAIDPTGNNSDHKKTVSLSFNNGVFSAPSINLGKIIAGRYRVLIKSPKYLRKLITTRDILSTGNNTFTFPAGITLTDGIGDINDDNILDISDYNAILGCYGGKIDTLSCSSKDLADLNDDNNIDGIDYNLFLKSLSLTSRQGD